MISSKAFGIQHVFRNFSKRCFGADGYTLLCCVDIPTGVIIQFRQTSGLLFLFISDAIKLTACYWDVVFCVHVILHKAYRITIHNKEWSYTFCLSNENVIFFKDHGQDLSKENPMII